MTKDSLAPASSPGIAPDDVAALLGAARSALDLLDRIDKHAPEGFCMGGEGRVRKQLREAVRRCSFEIRPCSACDGGVTHAPTRHPMARPRTITCPECSGTGERKVFAYPKPKAGRG